MAHEAAERLRADREEFTDGPDLTTTGGSGSGAAPTRTVEQAPAVAERRLTPGRLAMAFFPYLLIIVVFSLAKLWGPAKDGLAATDIKIRWPGLDGNVLSAAGKPVTSTVYNFQMPLLARHPAAHLRVHHRAGLPRPADPGVP